jgi:hypothetical protein
MKQLHSRQTGKQWMQAMPKKGFGVFLHAVAEFA